MQVSTSETGPGVVAPGARLEKLAGGFDFTEGSTCDAHGNIFFTDQPSDRILKWSAEGELSTFLHPAGRANGMYFDPRGHLIACADERNALWSIAPDGTVGVIVAEYEGKPLNGPNDVWVRSDGAIYFTDPFYKRSWWTHNTMPQDGQHVYFLCAERRRLVRVADDLETVTGQIGEVRRGVGQQDHLSAQGHPPDRLMNSSVSVICWCWAPTADGRRDDG